MAISDQEKLINGDLQIQLFLNNYNPTAVEVYTDGLKRIQESVLIELAGLEEGQDVTRLQLEQMRRSIDFEFSRLSGEALDGLSEDMRVTAETQYEATTSLMADVFGLSVQTTMASIPREAYAAITDPDRKIKLQSGGKVKTYNPSTEIEKITNGTAKEFRDIAGDAVIRGQGNRETFREAKARLGVSSSKSAAQLEAVTRTAIADGMREARDAGYDAIDEAEPGIIKGWMYNATLDNRTSLLCAGENGKVREKRSDLQEVPAHFHCRSVHTPVTDFTDLSTIQAKYHIRDKRMVNHRDGTRSTKFTNAEKGVTEIKRPTSKQKESASDVWFRQMPDTKIMKNGREVNWKEEYLGKEKYRLYKEHNLSFSDLVGRGGKPLTIKQIRKNLDLE